MEKLLSLLKDGRSRPVELIAAELGTSVEDVRRKIEFLERAGAIRRVSQEAAAAGACTGCSGCQHGKAAHGRNNACSSCSDKHGKAAHGSGQPHCAGCMPEGGFKNMGVMWEVVG